MQHHFEIHVGKLEVLWKLNEKSNQRSKNFAWRKWYHVRKGTIKQKHGMDCSVSTNSLDNKFYVDDDDELIQDDDENDDADSDEIDRWSINGSDDKLLFEKRRDNSSNNSIYHISSFSPTRTEKPVSLLTRMLQQQSDNENKQKLPQITQQPQQFLRRCQSKYRSLNEWFSNTTFSTNVTKK